MREPFAAADTKDTGLNLSPIPCQQRDEDDRGNRRDEEIEGELRIVIAEGEQQADLIADESDSNSEDDRVDSIEPLVVVDDPQPSRETDHHQSVPEVVKVNSTLGDDHDVGQQEVEDSCAEEASRERQGGQERQSVLVEL